MGSDDARKEFARDVALMTPGRREPCLSFQWWWPMINDMLVAEYPHPSYQR